jgi:hypothetical protein
MNAKRCVALWALGLGLLSAAPVLSQCGTGKVAFGEKLETAFYQAAGLTSDSAKELLDQNEKSGLEQAQEAARFGDAAKITAPSDSSAGTSLVDHAFFPSLVGLAIENGLVSTSQDVTTVSLNLFAFLSAAQPRVIFDQREYLSYDGLRRLGGSVSFGGKGEKLDQDGDGTVDEPLTAKEAGDIVNYEVSYRLFGTRDPRDQKNFDRIASAFRPAHADFQAKKDEFEKQVSEQVKNVVDDEGCVTEEAWQSLLKDPAFATKVKVVAEALTQTLADRDDAVKSVTEGPVWSLVVGGVSRKPEFGADSVKVALRGELRKSTFNAEWMKIDSLTGASDPKMLKAGYQYSSTWLKGASFAPNGIGVSASAAYERYEDCPEATHKEIAKAQLKMEIPWAKAAKIPISISWANHRDLLTDERDIRGHIGFTFDLAKLVDFVKDTNAAQVAAELIRK